MLTRIKNSIADFKSVWPGSAGVPPASVRQHAQKSSRRGRSAGEMPALPGKAFAPWREILSLFLLLTTITSSLPARAQDSRELEQERTASKKLKGEHPLDELMRTRKSALRPELLGVHPRVYVTDQ